MKLIGLSARRARLQRAGIVAAVAAVVIGATISAAGPALAEQVPTAQAAPAHATAPAGTVVRTVTLPAGSTTAHLSAGNVQATVTTMSPNIEIHCELYYKDPYKLEISNHGTWVIATNYVTCDHPVASIHVLVAVLQNGRTVAQDVVNSRESALAGALAQAPCSHGAGYQSGNYTLVTFPPTFTPPTWSATQDSHVKVLC